MKVVVAFLYVIYISSLAWTCLAINFPSNDYLVCKPVSELFEFNPNRVKNESSAQLRGPQGRPGKRGKIGLQGPEGPSGPPGPKGVVDWKEVENRISIAIERRLNRCSGKIWNGICYWLPRKVASSKDLQGKPVAERICRFFNGTLVDIANEEMYKELYDFLQRSGVFYTDHPNVDWINVWLASTYQGGEVRSSRGGTVYTQWVSGYPLPSDLRSAVIWQMATDSTRGRSRTGYYNDKPDQKYAIPFCCKEMS